MPSVPQRSALFLREPRFQGTRYQGPISVGPWCFLCALALSACRSASPEPVQYGEPVGVRLEGNSTERPFELAVAVSKERDPQPLLGAIVDLARAGIRACPAYLDAPAEAPSPPIAILISEGKISGAPDSNAPEAARCVVKAISGQKLSAALQAERKLDVLLQARALTP